MDSKIDKVAVEMTALKNRVENIEYELKHHVATKKDVIKILDHIDSFAGDIKTYNQKL